ncbi:hypothetical protein [uncultured Roseibium sp.]|uniref:tetratricopeptide repeat protein n=1 Tax=uncultured Roseibium sp. TaxID=1936171 RepID=UPI00260F2EC0|nr:hypothetical protein [uncultured Roseibium sp.]
MKLVWCLFLSLFLFTTQSDAAGKSGETGRDHSWREEREGQGVSGYQGTGSAHFGGLPDAQELEQLLAREAAQDPEDLFRLGLAYENSELWEADYKKAFSYFQKSEALGFPWAKSQVGYYYETGLAGPQDYKKAVRLYQEGADFGDSWSGLRLGYLYLEGEGIRQHDGQAFFWIQWASRGGVPEATSALGWLHENGRGTAKDLTEAARLYRRAGEAGNMNAWVNLGLMHETGVFGTPDYEQATALYRKASDAGFSRGKHNLGIMYYWGQGVAQDQEHAVSLFRSAVELGYPYAHVSLGLAYEQGSGIAQDYAKAAAEYQKAIDAEGYARAKAYLGWLYQEGLGVDRDVKKSQALFEDAAAEGQPFALTELGYSLVFGSGGITQDVHRGRRLLEQAAAEDYLASILVLADMYENGTGVARDSAAAFHFYKQAADLGDPEALVSLGDHYLDGDQVERDFDKALELYNQSLDAGNKNALLDLGYLHTETDWDGHDFQKAMEHFRRADEAGVENAATFLGIAHFHGEWAPENDQLARAYFKRAAENGFYLAAKYLGYMEEEGLGGLTEKYEAVRHYELAAEGDELFAAQRLVTAFGDDGWMTPNPKKALRWTIRAGELGDPEAAFEAAEALYGDPSQKNLEKASNLYRVAADDGNLEASVKWARLQILGEVEGADYFAAIKELKSVAEAAPLSAIGPLSQLIRNTDEEPATPRADAERELFLGIAYANGIIFPQDAEKAETHLRRSLLSWDFSSSSGQFALAVLLFQSVDRDSEFDREIVELLKRAANRGHANAQLILGQFYGKDLGDWSNLVEKNNSIALNWLRLAAEHNNHARYALALGIAAGWDENVDTSSGYGMLEDLAITGHSLSALQLGKFYADKSNGVDYRPDLAAHWYRKAARFGDSTSMFELGKLNDKGEVEGHSQAIAFKHYLAAAEAGHPEATRIVGERYQQGKGVGKNLILAETWLQKSVDLDMYGADLELASLHVAGDEFSIEKRRQAVNTLQSYVDRGDPRAMLALGRAYITGAGVEKNPGTGLRLFQDANNLVPGLARIQIAEYHFWGAGGVVNYELAFDGFSKSAKLSNPDAQYWLGWMYQNGLGTERNPEEAARLYRIAIEHGEHRAKVALGVLYFEGHGVRKDERMAAEYFQETSERGMESGRANLGWLMVNGFGVPKNVKEGFALIEQAASREDSYGAYYLAQLLEKGQDLKPKQVSAINLYKIAARHGIAGAMQALERLEHK